MADAREWPGFRTVPVALKQRGIRSAEGDVTFPQAVIHREKKQDHRARKALAARTIERQNGHGDPLSRQQVGLRRGLASGEMSALQPHQHVLAATIRYVPGGRKTVLGLIQRASRNGDPDATAWWDVFMDLLPKDQLHVELDYVCEAAGIAPDRLMAVVVSTAMRFGADAAELVAAVTYPTIVHQTVKSASRIGGEYADVAQKDREMLLQHQRFVPVARGSIVTVNASAQAAAAAQQHSVPGFGDSLQGAMSAHQDVQEELKARRSLAAAELVED